MHAIGGSFRTELGEGPIWDSQRSCLWWVDVQTGHLCRLDAGQTAPTTRAMPKRPTSLALRADGGLVVVFRKQLGLIDGPDAPVQLLSLGKRLRSSERLNDCTVDEAGALWFGTMDIQQSTPIGRLFKVASQTEPVCMADGFTVTNGMAWNKTGECFYLVDSATHEIIEISAGTDTALGARRRLHRFVDTEMPDGLTIDAEGNLWTALVGAAQIACLSPEGIRIGTLHMDTQSPTSCAFGGADMRTLFATTMTLGLSPRQRAEQPNAGALFKAEMKIAGRPAATLASETLMTLRRLIGLQANDTAREIC